MGDVRDDDSVRRTDPLLANPVLATGETGQIERPGDDRSPWLIGILFAAFASLISGLATVALTRDDGSEAATDPSGVVVAEMAVESGTESTIEPALTTIVETSAPDSATPATDEAAVTIAPPLTSLGGTELPPPGFVRVGSIDLAIDRACEVHLPFAPADNDVQVSSYSFRSSDGTAQVVDRRFGGENGPVATLDGVRSSTIHTDESGESGAFVAEFAVATGEITVAVNPGSDGISCNDTLVTNEPGQFAFPHTRIVLRACVSGSIGSDFFATGLTSEGGRFTAQDNGDGSATLFYSDDELPSDLIDAAASGFRNGERFGYSGTVTNGVVTLDITIDFTPEPGRTCNNPSQL